MSEKTIDVYMNIQNDDDEYHEIYIKDDNITLNASTPIGVMRALYYLLDLASSAGGLTFDKKTEKSPVPHRYCCGTYSYHTIFAAAGLDKICGLHGALSCDRL